MIYKTKTVAGPNRNFEILDPLDFLAAVTSHIPNRGEHLVRYYGYYSSVQRGRRRRQGWEKMPLGPILLSDDAPHAKSVRAILGHLSLWEEPRPPPALPAARAPLELEYLAWVE